MKSSRFLLCAALLVSLPAVLPAAATVRIETVLYVFRDAAFDRITVGPEGPADQGHGTIFTAPATVMFDQQTLALDDTGYAWNRGRKPPPQFSVTGMPVVINFPGSPATIECGAPVQYLEKMADGGLQLREISADSPDWPRYRLTLTARPGASAGFVTTCDLDIVALQGREKIPGVDLEVGRPIMARFRDRIEISNPTGGWSGWLVRRPGGSDFSLLMLLKVTRGDEVEVPATASPRTPAAPAH